MRGQCDALEADVSEFPELASQKSPGQDSWFRSSGLGQEGPFLHHFSPFPCLQPIFTSREKKQTLVNYFRSLRPSFLSDKCFVRRRK